MFLTVQWKKQELLLWNWKKEQQPNYMDKLAFQCKDRTLLYVYVRQVQPIDFKSIQVFKEYYYYYARRHR